MTTTYRTSVELEVVSNASDVDTIFAPAPYDLTGESHIEGICRSSSIGIGKFDPDTSTPLVGIFKNLNKSNTATLTYQTLGGAAVEQTHQIPPGEVLVVPDLSPDDTSIGVAWTGDDTSLRMIQYFICGPGYSEED